jgi:7-carboxy-7-deazaguanine synthase
MFRINEIFTSIQGEGRWTGTPATFVRFAGCNLKCIKSEQGFDCDTGQEVRIQRGLRQLVNDIKRCGRRFVILTGGEPMLQVTDELLKELRNENFYTAIETNGTQPITKAQTKLINWVTCSPKPGHPVELNDANEVKIILPANRYPPTLDTLLDAEYYYLSPVFNGAEPDLDSLFWILRYLMNTPNTNWMFTWQLHKILTKIVGKEVR